MSRYISGHHVPIVTPIPEGTTRPFCLGCSQPLSTFYRYDWPIEEPNPVGRHFEGFGYEGDGAFCSLRCCHRWAIRTLRRQVPGTGGS